MRDLTALTIRQAHEAMTAREFSAKEFTESFVKKISERDKTIHAYLEVFSDCLAQAKAVQKRFDDKRAGLLSGIPLAFKDNIVVKGKSATAGSRILEGFLSTYDATVVTKLREEGAVFLGRTNMDEFAMGSSTENSAFGPTKNPHDLERVPGGSSGGSGAAVAAGMAAGALGSETGGSVRQPASFCGVVGLKPTYGAVSRYGLIALGSSLDQIGPIGKTVDDVEIIFNTIRGTDPLDSTSRKAEKKYPKAKTIGVPRRLLKIKGLHPSARHNFETALTKLKSLGFTIKDIDLPHIEYSLAAYYVIMPAEASSNLARFDGVKYGLHRSGANLIEDYFSTRGEGFGKEPRRRIMLGTYVLSHGYYEAYYGKAVALRSLIASEFERAFSEIDIIATPTTPAPAFKIGEKANDPLAMYLEDIFTVSANIAGLPAISLPSGYSQVGTGGAKLPLGLQLIGRSFDETSLFAVGKKFLGEK